MQKKSGLLISSRKAGLAALGLGLGLSLALVSPSVAQQRRPAGPVKYTSPPPAGQPINIVAEANLKKPRPKPGADFTGMWLLQRSVNPPKPDYEFWPLPKFTPAGQAIFDARERANKEGRQTQTDQDAAACYPPGLPRVMTRVWNMMTIQLPTGIVMINGFTNQVRFIYMDGRSHTDPEVTLPSYNGESIGHWEGSELVIDSTNFEGTHHWVQGGVPTSDKFHVVERWKLIEGGKVLEVKFTMTDPTYWEGEYLGTKRYDIRDDNGIVEAHCIAAEMANLPSARSAR